MWRLQRLINLISLVANTKVVVGKVTSPFGTEMQGFKVTIGGVTDPAEIERTYDDITRILHSNPGTYHIKEQRDENGRFKSYTVST